MAAVPNRREWARPAWALTFALLGALGCWWTVLLGRLQDENFLLKVEIFGESPDLHAYHTRQRLMLYGESAAATALVFALVALSARQAVRERDQSRRLEGVLAASTHELKTPVAGVKALLESLEGGVIPAESAGPFLHRGLEACSRLEHLIEGLLAYQAAVARGSDRMEERPLGRWVGEVLAHRLATMPGESVVDELGSLREAAVRARPDAFRVILENLLDNAVKYGAKRVVLRAEPSSTGLRLVVSDDGAGFEPTEAEHLFEPYRRGKGGAGAHGTGLGLYLSRELARGMEGDLRATSAGPGQGATFVLSLRRSNG